MLTEPLCRDTGSTDESLTGQAPPRPAAPPRPRALLAGIGTVGAGVNALLRSRPGLYDLTAIYCREPARHAALDAETRARLKNRLTVDALAPLRPGDLVVELMGGTDEASTLVHAALARGIDVVTANKTLLATEFESLTAAARDGGAQLRYSAAVGGGVPMLETVDSTVQRVRITEIEAVLNGTNNFILERLAAGVGLEQAVTEAQAAGFAEADPSADLSGADAAQKLSLLIRHAFAGTAIDPASIPCTNLLDPVQAARAATPPAGHAIKQIARVTAVKGQLTPEIVLEAVPLSSPFGAAHGEGNALILHTEEGGQITVTGKGAGRWPTAGAVFSDIKAMAAARANRPSVHAL